MARQMEILHDAAVQERLQALDWRIPAGALKYLADAQNTNGTSGDKSRDNQGTVMKQFSQTQMCSNILVCVFFFLAFFFFTAFFTSNFSK